jgi:hypothetical protein
MLCLDGGGKSTGVRVRVRVSISIDVETITTDNSKAWSMELEAPMYVCMQIQR